MARRKKREELGIARPAIGLLGAAVTLGVGAQVVSQVGGSTAASAGGGLVVASSFLPVAGTVIGGGIVIGQLRGLQTQVEPRRKRRKR